MCASWKGFECLVDLGGKLDIWHFPPRCPGNPKQTLPNSIKSYHASRVLMTRDSTLDSVVAASSREAFGIHFRTRRQLDFRACKVLWISCS